MYLYPWSWYLNTEQNTDLSKPKTGEMKYYSSFDVEFLSKLYLGKFCFYIAILFIFLKFYKEFFYIIIAHQMWYIAIHSMGKINSKSGSIFKFIIGYIFEM